MNHSPDNPTRIVQSAAGLNANSYISIGLVVTIIGATWVIASSVNKATYSIDTAKMEFAGRMDKFEARLSVMEKNRESWTDGDMFRWAVHLQKENPSLKIPEPEMHSTR